MSTTTPPESPALGAAYRIEARIAAPLADVWAAIRDVGAVHKRLSPGFAVDTVLKDGVRTVTFVNGMVVTETIISLDDENHRLGYGATGERVSFHFASLEVVADGDGTRLIWTTDVRPKEMISQIGPMMEQGAAVMKKTLEAAPRS